MIFPPRPPPAPDIYKFIAPPSVWGNKAVRVFCIPQLLTHVVRGLQLPSPRPPSPSGISKFIALSVWGNPHPGRVRRLRLRHLLQRANLHTHFFTYMAWWALAP
jgi:hypothetical protein